MKLLVEGINLHFLGVPINMATAASYSGLIARLARFADRIMPMRVAPEYYRNSPGCFLTLFLGMGAFVAMCFGVAIMEREPVMIWLAVFLGLLFGRVGLFALSEVFATPYFQGKPEIFLSYRREDTMGMAGHIYDRLREWFRDCLVDTRLRRGVEREGCQKNSRLNARLVRLLKKQQGSLEPRRSRSLAGGCL